MILHLLHDEKITNRMIANFEEALPGQNIYIYIIPHSDYKLRFIDASKYNIILQLESNQCVIDYSLVDKVFIHFLTLPKIDFCNRYIKKSVIIYWGVWGADLYNRQLAGRGYRLYFSINYKLNFFETFIDILRIIKHRLIYDKKYVDFINKRVSYIGGLNCDFELVTKYLLRNPKKHFELSAYGIDEILGPQLMGRTADTNSNVVLCANSASYTNNHNYVIKKLRKLVDGISPVKMILSYGGDKGYINSIIRNAKKNLGSCFTPVTDFLSLDEYNDLMCTARICVYGSWRQEAVGNIIISLYLGAKVYLSKHSPLLKELQSKGYKVFTLEDASKESFYEKLDYKTQIINRTIAVNSNNRPLIIESINMYFR